MISGSDGSMNSSMMIKFISKKSMYKILIFASQNSSGYFSFIVNQLTLLADRIGLPVGLFIQIDLKSCTHCLSLGVNSG